MEVDQASNIADSSTPPTTDHNGDTSTTTSVASPANGTESPSPNAPTTSASVPAPVIVTVAAPRSIVMPVLQQCGQVYVGPGAKKEAQVLGLGLSSLSRADRSDLDRAKRFAIDQSIKHVMLKQQTAHQENQQKVAMYAQALSLMARVYIGSISFEIREDQIRDTFAEFGPVKSINMSFDASTGHHKGYAFLEYDVPEAALLAQDAMNGALLGGRNIKVERGRVQLQLGRSQAMPQAQPIIDMIMTEARKYNRIYVASVHEDLTEEDLRTVFSSFGDIIKCQLAKSPGGRHRGFGYLEFETAKSAAEAISGMNMFDLGGKNMRVGKCITPPEALNYIVPNTQTALPTAAAMAAAAITARIQAQEAAGKSGKSFPSPGRSPSPLRKRRSRRSPSPSPKKRSPSPKPIKEAPVAPKTSTRFGEKAAIAPPPMIVDPLAGIAEPVPSPPPQPTTPQKPKQRPSFTPAATVEVAIEKPVKEKKSSKDILSRIKLFSATKAGEKATFAPLPSTIAPRDGNVFEEELGGPQLAITGGPGGSNSRDLAIINDSKAVATVSGKNVIVNADGTVVMRKKKRIAVPKAKGPQLNTVQALEAAQKAGAISDQIHQAGQENDEQPLSAMEINEIRGNDARHLLMRKLMRAEQTRVLLLKNMVSPEEVDEFLQEEVKEECAKHGQVIDVTIVQVRGEIRIFVRYDKVEEATAARAVFDKRWFNGRQIEAIPYDEELLNHNDYLG